VTIYISSRCHHFTVIRLLSNRLGSVTCTDRSVVEVDATVEPCFYPYRHSFRSFEELDTVRQSLEAGDDFAVAAVVTSGAPDERSRRQTDHAGSTVR